MTAEESSGCHLLQVAYALDPVSDALAVLGWILYPSYYSSCL